MFWVKLETMLCENTYFSPKAKNLADPLVLWVFLTVVKQRPAVAKLGT